MHTMEVKVVPAQGKWQVRANERVEGEFESLPEAEDFGRKRAREAEAELLLYGRDARVRERESYSQRAS